jgi:hypothetical protein
LPHRPLSRPAASFWGSNRVTRLGGFIRINRAEFAIDHRELAFEFLLLREDRFLLAMEVIARSIGDPFLRLNFFGEIVRSLPPRIGAERNPEPEPPPIRMTHRSIRMGTRLR